MRKSLSSLSIGVVSASVLVGLASSTAAAYVVNQIKLDKNFAVLKSGAGETPSVGSILQMDKNGQPCSLKVYSVKGPWVAATPDNCPNFSDLSAGDTLTDPSAPAADAASPDPQNTNPQAPDANSPDASAAPSAAPSNDPQYDGGSNGSQSGGASNDPQYSGSSSNNERRSGPPARRGRRGKPAETVDHHLGALLYYSLAGNPTYKYTTTTTTTTTTTVSADGNYVAGGAPGIGLRYMYLPMSDDPVEASEFHLGFNIGYSYDFSRKITGYENTAPASVGAYTDLNFQISNLEMNLMGEISGFVFFLGPNYAAFNVSGTDKNPDLNYLAAFGLQAGIGYMGPGFGVELAYRSLNGKLGSAVQESEITTDKLNLSGLLLRGTAFFSF